MASMIFEFKTHMLSIPFGSGNTYHGNGSDASSACAKKPRSTTRRSIMCSRSAQTAQHRNPTSRISNAKSNAKVRQNTNFEVSTNHLTRAKIILFCPKMHWNSPRTQYKKIWLPVLQWQKNTCQRLVYENAWKNIHFCRLRFCLDAKIVENHRIIFRK